MSRNSNPFGTSIFLTEHKGDDEPPPLAPRRSRGTPQTIGSEGPTQKPWGSYQISLDQVPQLPPQSIFRPSPKSKP